MENTVSWHGGTTNHVDWRAAIHHLRVTRAAIQHKTLPLHQSDDYAASRGWLENFLKQNNFSLWRRTTVSQQLPQDQISKVSTFVLRVRKMWLLRQYPMSCTGNMDVTPLWLDMPGDATVSAVGEHSVSVCTTGHDEGRFTVIMAQWKETKAVCGVEGSTYRCWTYSCAWCGSSSHSELLDEWGLDD